MCEQHCPGGGRSTHSSHLLQRPRVQLPVGQPATTPVHTETITTTKISKMENLFSTSAVWNVITSYPGLPPRLYLAVVELLYPGLPPRLYLAAVEKSSTSCLRDKSLGGRPGYEVRNVNRQCLSRLFCRCALASFPGPRHFRLHELSLFLRVTEKVAGLATRLDVPRLRWLRSACSIWLCSNDVNYQ